MLRDLIRNLSDGIEYINFKGLTIGVVDERGEIGAMYKGIPQNNIGIRTDILDGVPKAIGMEMLIRSMAPQVIVADEIGNIDDIKAICYASFCGVKGIFTAHGSNMNDLRKSIYLSKLLEDKIIEKVIFIDNVNKGKVKEVVQLF